MLDTSFSLEKLNKSSAETLADHLGIEYIEIGKDFLKARMPVDRRTLQPMGILNGGASAALAETVGSMASYLCLDREKQYCVGLDIKVNHIKPVFKGYVTATATPVHLGISTHVWQIDSYNDAGERMSFCTLTTAILDLDKLPKEARNKLLSFI